MLCLSIYVQVNILKVLCINFRWLPQFHCMCISITFFVVWNCLQNFYTGASMIFIFYVFFCSRKMVQHRSLMLKHFWESALAQQTSQQSPWWFGSPLDHFILSANYKLIGQLCELLSLSYILGLLFYLSYPILWFL